MKTFKEVISPLSKGTRKHIDRVRDANDARLQKLRAAKRKKNPTFMDKLKKGFKKEELQLEAKGMPVFVKVIGDMPPFYIGWWAKFNELLKKHKGKFKNDTRKFGDKEKYNLDKDNWNGYDNVHTLLFRNDKGWEGFHKDYLRHLHKRPSRPAVDLKGKPDPNSDWKDYDNNIWDLKFHIVEEVELDEALNKDWIKAVNNLSKKMGASVAKSSKGGIIPFASRVGKSTEIGYTDSKGKRNVVFSTDKPLSNKEEDKMMDDIRKKFGSKK